MQESEILSIAEKLIPAYHSEDLDNLLAMLTEGQSPSVKLLVKMELNKMMAPCTKSVDLRGRVQGECREYELDGRKHWLDDVAFNEYQKGTKKFGSYTEGVWNALCNTRNNFRVMQQRGDDQKEGLTSPDSPFEVDPVTLGFDLKRRESRLLFTTQMEMKLPSGQLVHGVSVDLSGAGGRFKVPSAFTYKQGEVVDILFTELTKKSKVVGLNDPIQYRVVGVDESYENDAVKYLRTLRITDTDVIQQVIEESLQDKSNKSRKDNQDKIIRAKTRCYEHFYLKNACSLPLFFSDNELKLVLITDNNQPIWQYWHDELNQQNLSGLFNQQRMNRILNSSSRQHTNTVYSFKHAHQRKQLFFSMLGSEASPEHLKLFWHVGAKKPTWRAFKFSLYELTDREKEALQEHAEELILTTEKLTHYGILQEIANSNEGPEYLEADKPKLASKELNPFRQVRSSKTRPTCIYFDSQSPRKEIRYHYRTKIAIKFGQKAIPGASIDFSKHGLNVMLSEPLEIKAEEMCDVSFSELQMHDKKLALSNIPYQVIRVSDKGRRLQLVIEENSHTTKTIAFLNRLIEYNQNKLIPIKEVLPTDTLLNGIHDILLDKLVCSPVFIDNRHTGLRPTVIGVSYPLEPYLTFLGKLGHEQRLSLEPIFKGRSNSLLAAPMKHVEGAEPQYHEVYISVVKFNDRVRSFETELSNDFYSNNDRVTFIQKALLMGDFYAIRVSGVPVFDPRAQLVPEDIRELAEVSSHQARNLEKELSAIVGYSELVDVTQEVLLRLGIDSDTN
ncbi:PilZ domain-containing protein [Vibrio sp. S4M6]|uniref:PilZ domain-containing protein n=1 Tax=Vibrio sinus TaxID=2946865 RepID=UPI002029F16F|nr:PilZ domain-containing protein [Vibrio sinus]MCL9781440.1 PilZ domain-containing protein [Vibrio sinus]